jgi:hypothetical protein
LAPTIGDIFDLYPSSGAAATIGRYDGRGGDGPSAERDLQREAGVDLVTLGDYAYKKQDIIDVLQKDEHICRPANFPPEMAYPVESPGKIGKGKVFCTLQGKDGKPGTGGDGCTIDIKGNLYVTSSIGVQVFDPNGKFLGAIAFPEQPANVTFGGADMKTLYVTARTSLYTVPMEATGHVFPAGEKKP